MKRLLLLLTAALACSAVAAHAAATPTPSSHPLGARITVTTTQGSPTKKGIPSTLAGRGRSSQLGRLSLSGSGYQRQGPGYLVDDLRAKLSFASGGSITVHLAGTERFSRNMTLVTQAARFTITGGLGRYGHATGNGTMHARCPNDPNAASLVCTQTWKGMLRY